jgi:DNA-binding IclR family transcriptional regulator
VVAAQLGISISSPPARSPDADLADATSADRQSLYRLLRTLSSRGIFREHEGEEFTLTPLADASPKEAHDSVRAGTV